ncbi:hypothetical protein DF121_23965 [Burkholderia stagnalis]|nr:hypothetical protein DF145_24155 [Burkholderia stagnalis]RQX95542.1 hypothetical protein DF121_23965 [Burkholderia stagnalis]RQY18556.1 hypothetical protein DF115_13760 [Burkholderia stagnalis]RQY27882.1 hypothetical protein DF114_24575 [Burkholderia stagnalis]
MTRSPWSLAEERARCNRFTGFISEPGGRFVSQRICVRYRHTAIQNPSKNNALRRTRAAFQQARALQAAPTRDAAAGTRHAPPARTTRAPPMPRNARPCRLR